MRRASHLALAALLAIFAAAMAANAHAATPAGTISFVGHIVDSNTPFPTGSVVTVRGAVVARSQTCVEARVDRPQSPHGALLWLCSADTRTADALPNVGISISARARITRIETTATGDMPYSDSFVLLRAD